MLVSCCTNPKKKTKIITTRARTAVELLRVLTKINIAREKSNPTLWNLISKLERQCPNFRDNVAVLKRVRKLLPLFTKL